MNLLATLRARFAAALKTFVEPTPELLDQVRRSQDPKFGDFQANCAMPLKNQLKLPPQEIAQRIVAALEVDDLCEPPEIAGPGFINLRLKNAGLEAALQQVLLDDRLTVAQAPEPRTYVVDFSGPNVAKPMHVGHIRSTVIGDALVRVLKFLGHRVIGDNHIGDWGTQFGMIIYGYRHFLDAAAYQANQVHELARLYRLVRQLVDYHAAQQARPALVEKVKAAEAVLERVKSTTPEPQQAKQWPKQIAKAERSLAEVREELGDLDKQIAAVDSSPNLARLAAEHPAIGKAALEETAKLHAGDADNRALWKEIVPPCLEEIEKIYKRLDVRFDYTLGESFYQDRLSGVVQDLVQKQIASESQGAIVVPLDGFDTPLLIQKSDGAFLYATTDLATIQYRMETWSPDAVLYVVDHRQSLHFEQLFATAKQWGYPQVELAHVGFGTVMGPDNKPYKTRSGDTVGLEGLLDEAVAYALRIVDANDDENKTGPQLSSSERQAVAEVVGLGAIKYADLSHHRTSDYVFSHEKMIAFKGNTGAYLQYVYARVQSIFAKGAIEPQALIASQAAIIIGEPSERALALKLLAFESALLETVADYRPNVLTSYLFELADAGTTFYENCTVLKAETEPLRRSRLLLCHLLARTIRVGLSLLGIDVCEKM